MIDKSFWEKAAAQWKIRSESSDRPDITINTASLVDIEPDDMFSDENLGDILDDLDDDF